MALQLLVIDGADEGRVFSLVDGSQTVGNSRKHTDICLHDLLMSRVHCQLDVAGDTVTVTDMERSTGTLVNGQKVTKHQLNLGDVIRAGNSYLRLQTAEAGAPAGHRRHEPGKLPHLTFEQYDELAEHVLAHYDLDAVLGRGHTGVVFRATDLKDDHAVALKVLHPDFPKTEAEMQNFVKVMKPALPMRHPHLVSYLGAGKAGHFVWIATQFVDGESLASLLQRTQPDRKIDWHRGFRVLSHLARALEYLHGLRMVHSNITPKNIVVDGVEHQTKLTDFVHFKALEGSAAQMATLEAKILAELPYMAPEQTQGDAFVDGLSDIYSLGVVAYHMLTGRQPFSGESPEDIISQIQQGGATKPRKLQKGIPDALERIVLRMMALKQEERYQTAAELVADLEPIAEQHEVTV